MLAIRPCPGNLVQSGRQSAKRQAPIDRRDPEP